MAEDWYRNTTWSAEIEEKFLERLKRSRSQGPQYLVIQSGTLAKVEPAAALGLVDRYFETGDTSFRNSAFCARAKALETLGRFDEAVEAYRAALEWEKSHPGHISTAWLDLPYLIATRSLLGHFELGLEMLLGNKRGLVFHSETFVYSVSLALIYWQMGQRTLARDHAERALAAAAIREPQLSRHKNIGLVEAKSAPDVERMKRIVDGKDPLRNDPLSEVKRWFGRG
jgi:tetratricopeptide (TPR) repeat protein